MWNFWELLPNFSEFQWILNGFLVDIRRNYEKTWKLWLWHENTTTSRTTRLVFSNISTRVNIFDNQTFCFVYEAYKYTESEGAIEMPYYVVISENVNGFQCAVASCVGSIIMSVLRRCFSIHPCIYNIRSYCIHS